MKKSLLLHLSFCIQYPLLTVRTCGNPRGPLSKIHVLGPASIKWFRAAIAPCEANGHEEGEQSAQNLHLDFDYCQLVMSNALTEVKPEDADQDLKMLTLAVLFACLYCVLQGVDSAAIGAVNAGQDMDAFFELCGFEGCDLCGRTGRTRTQRLVQIQFLPQ